MEDGGPSLDVEGGGEGRDEARECENVECNAELLFALPGVGVALVKDVERVD